MAELLANNAASQLAEAFLINDTSLVLDDTSSFPVPTGGDTFRATLFKIVSGVEANHEIVLVSANDTGTNTLTVTRAQEGTSQVDFAIDDYCELRLTAGAEGLQPGASPVGKQLIWIPASAMKPRLTGGCASLAYYEMPVNDHVIPYMAFSPTALEFADFSICMPKNWDEGALTFEPVWFGTSAESNAVKWGLRGVAVGNDDALDNIGTVNLEVSSAYTGTALDLRIGPESGSLNIPSRAENDMLILSAFRDGGDAGDTYTLDANLIGMKVYYTTNAPNND